MLPSSFLSPFLSTCLSLFLSSFLSFTIFLCPSFRLFFSLSSYSFSWFLFDCRCNNPMNSETKRSTKSHFRTKSLQLLLRVSEVWNWHTGSRNSAAGERSRASMRMTATVAQRLTPRCLVMSQILDGVTGAGTTVYRHSTSQSLAPAVSSSVAYVQFTRWYAAFSEIFGRFVI
jgi:hypothetical protein